MRYQLTNDAEYVTRCLTSPSLWRMSSDDGMIGIDPELFFATIGNNIWLRTPHGVLIGDPRNFITCEAHLALLPEAAGIAVIICKGAIAWMFENTQFERITTSIPEYNKLAIRLALKSGMELMGVNQKSFKKNGVLFDQYLYGISKEN